MIFLLLRTPRETHISAINIFVNLLDATYSRMKAAIAVKNGAKSYLQRRLSLQKVSQQRLLEQAILL